MRPAIHSILAAAVIGVALACHAQDPAWKLELKPEKGLPNGKVAIVKGTAKPGGDRFFIPNVFVLQPVVVTLVAGNPRDELRLVLGKDRWDETLREAATGGDGKAIVKLRTQGELRMTVKGARPGPYYLVAWVGDEVKVEPEPVLTSMAEYRKAHPGSWLERLGPALAWASIAAVLAGLAAGAFLFLRRRSAK